jgi:hypothetical protein
MWGGPAPCHPFWSGHVTHDARSAHGPAAPGLQTQQRIGQPVQPVPKPRQPSGRYPPGPGRPSLAGAVQHASSPSERGHNAGSISPAGDAEQAWRHPFDVHGAELELAGLKTWVTHDYWTVAPLGCLCGQFHRDRTSDERRCTDTAGGCRYFLRAPSIRLLLQGNGLAGMIGAPGAAQAIARLAKSR